MPSPLVTSIDWGDVVTTTLEYRSKKLADNISNNNALLAILKKKGKRTWTQFALDTGVTRQSLLNYQNGKFQPRFGTLVKLGLVKDAANTVPNPAG